MKNILKYLFIVVSFNFLHAQKVFQKNIEIPSDKIISFSLDGTLINLNNFPEELKIVEDPFELNGKTIFNVKVDKKWKGIKQFTVLNSLEEYYNIDLSINDSIDTPSVFLTSKNIIKNINDGFIAAQNKLEEPGVNEPKETIDSSLYIHHAKNINSQLKRDFRITKKRYNGIEIELCNVLTKDNLIYVRVKIKNKSPYDFVLNDVIFSLVEEEKFTKKTTEDETISCLFMYNKKERTIYKNKFLYKTFVFRAFKLTKTQFFKITLSENRTKENIEMYINNTIMNDPIVLNIKSETNNKPQPTIKK